MDNTYITNVLSSIHVKENFDCKKDLLNGYIHRQASQDVKRRISACFVLADDDNIIKGYYTLSSSSIRRDLLPLEIIKKLPESYTDLPVTLLGRLAVDKNSFGKGLGELLLLDALKRSYDTSVHNVASMAVIVDPLDQEAIGFYEKYGFILIPDSGKMFLTMNTLAKLFG